MVDRMTRNETIQIAFLIFPGFPMACLTSMIEPLRAANEIGGRPAFAWTLVAECRGRVMSSAEVAFEPDRLLSDPGRIDMMFLLSSPVARFENDRTGPAALRSLARHGTVLGGISGGVFPLVRAGLMEGQPVSVHWCYEAAFQAEFPAIKASSDVIVHGRRRYTAAGAAAAFDLALILVEEALGAEVANEVACWFQHPLMRGEGVKQRKPVAQSPATGDRLPDLVARCITLFADRMADPISVAEIAETVGVTPRQVERAFKKATGQSPTHYYRTMRMKAARQMVMYSRDRIGDIAAAVGYASPAPMIAHYRAAFGLTPKEDRQRINRFRVEGNVPVPS